MPVHLGMAITITSSSLYEADDTDAIEAIERVEIPLAEVGVGNVTVTAPVMLLRSDCAG